MRYMALPYAVIVYDVRFIFRRLLNKEVFLSFLFVKRVVFNGFFVKEHPLRSK